jgi:GNAT superfamily N-acetyltransferase
MNGSERGFDVHQATEADLPVLAGIRAPTALHKDRLRDADGERLLYLVIAEDGASIGFGLLVFVRPVSWPDGDDTTRLPAMVDLFIRPDRRSRGAGAVLIREMESIVHARGGTRLYLGVDPVDNPRAQELYLRLGYKPLQAEPHRSRWKFMDSDGTIHQGDEWSVDMVKDLGG